MRFAITIAATALACAAPAAAADVFTVREGTITNGTVFFGADFRMPGIYSVSYETFGAPITFISGVFQQTIFRCDRFQVSPDPICNQQPLVQVAGQIVNANAVTLRDFQLIVGRVDIGPNSWIDYVNDAFLSSNINIGTNVPTGYRVTILVTPSVPEPATWAMMIGGLGFVGSTLRSRRSRTHRLYADF